MELIKKECFEICREKNLCDDESFEQLLSAHSAQIGQQLLQ